ncbi:hypothetical protein RRG08_007422 [Elysia crispata]|uniref:DUF6729 domain-containing protein n=1 Tax=Elysia crispata TaxID=231223 RepID=A0AAE1DY66_9GAST|nr:hypothetical protein RRG08_007422 [Elysia crispata]
MSASPSSALGSSGPSVGESCPRLAAKSTGGCVSTSWATRTCRGRPQWGSFRATSGSSVVVRHFPQTTFAQLLAEPPPGRPLHLPPHQQRQLQVALRKEWLKTLPAQDHVWVANALFTESGRLKSQHQMWWHPPQPALVYSQPPATPNVFFHHRFFLWMPYRMLSYPFVCSQPGCDRRQLSSCGLYKTVRRTGR